MIFYRGKNLWARPGSYVDTSLRRTLVPKNIVEQHVYKVCKQLMEPCFKRIHF